MAWRATGQLTAVLHGQVAPLDIDRFFGPAVDAMALSGLIRGSAASGALAISGGLAPTVGAGSCSWSLPSSPRASITESLLGGGTGSGGVLGIESLCAGDISMGTRGQGGRVPWWSCSRMAGLGAMAIWSRP